MIATPENTERTRAAHPELHGSVLGRTGLHVTGAGFGSYRVSVGVEGHRRALERALLAGINLIDTSTNYADGGSEELIGQTLLELVRDGRVDRRGVVVVSKVGYMQGSNYAMAVERAQAGSGFPEVVEYGEGLWHCIAPEFIEDQLTRSLDRLNMQTLDVLLLHNPEYYLGWAAREGVPLSEARSEYYRRIESAFRHLEREVERGRIQWYGISSNSFPHESESEEFTSLEDVLAAAARVSDEHHFAVIQFPANLLERGFVDERNQSGGRTLMDVARERNLGVLINRPLNAIVDGRLMRLADFGGRATDGDVTPDILRIIDQLEIMEPPLIERIATEGGLDAARATAVREFLTTGPAMRRYWHELETIEQANDVVTQLFAPRLGYVAQLLRERGDAALIEAFAAYLGRARDLFELVRAHYGARASERGTRLREQLRSLTDTPLDGSLSSLAIRMLLGVDGVDCVLVGMRRDEYVDDVLEALRCGALGGEEAWRELGERDAAGR